MRTQAPLCLLLALVAAVACVTETEADRRLRERERGDPFGPDGPAEEPDAFLELGIALNAIFTHARIHQAEAPYRVVIEGGGAGEIHLIREEGEAIVERRPLPAGLTILNEPGPITLHRDGRASWPQPDQTLLASDATACDLTVSHPASGWICAYDLIKGGSGVEVQMKATAPGDW